jgi:hypothetical protein
MDEWPLCFIDFMSILFQVYPISVNDFTPCWGGFA